MYKEKKWTYGQIDDLIQLFICILFFMLLQYYVIMMYKNSVIFPKKKNSKMNEFTQYNNETNAYK